MQGTAAIKEIARPGLAAWLLHALTAGLLAIGVYSAFFIPLLTAIWGFTSMRKARKQFKKEWITYTLIAASLFASMLIMQLFFTPWGEADQEPIGTAGWQQSP